MIKRWGAIMRSIFTFLYRSYCLMRLQEIRRYRMAT